MGEHLGTRVEQEKAENAQNPLESVDDGHASKNKDAAQNECPENAPEQHFVLVFPLDAEVGKQHQKDKKIVGRERFFDEIGGEIFHCHLVWVVGIEQPNAESEQQGNANPHGSHLQCLADANLVFAVFGEHFEVGNQHQHN